MENPLVKPFVRYIELGGERFQMDELVVPATAPEILWGYGLPLSGLNISEEKRNILLVQYNDKLAHQGSNICLERRGKKLFIVHLYMCGETCTVYEEEISESQRVWRPEQFRHRIIVPKIN